MVPMPQIHLQDRVLVEFVLQDAGDEQFFQLPAQGALRGQEIV
jgi:hypothetical protein